MSRAATGERWKPLSGIRRWTQWPESGSWIIGLFIGITLITSGWSEIMLAFAVRQPAPKTA